MENAMKEDDVDVVFRLLDALFGTIAEKAVAQSAAEMQRGYANSPRA
jgi:hypothetical protein